MFKYLFNQKLMLSLMEKTKYMYYEKMGNYLKKSDYFELDTLLLKLRKKSIYQIEDDFEIAWKFKYYKPE